MQSHSSLHRIWLESQKLHRDGASIGLPILLQMQEQTATATALVVEMKVRESCL